MNLTDYKLLKNEKKMHFWYKARKNLIKYLLSSKYNNFSQERIALDIGSGGGTELNEIEKIGKVVCLDRDREILSLIKKGSCQKIAADIEKYKLEKNKYDCICCFDVLEHLKDDEGAIINIYQALKANGFFFFTVPAFQFLFSSHDEIAGHQRRYSKKQIITKLKKSGFKIVTLNYWNFFLFPIILVFRLIKKFFYKFFQGKNCKSDAKPLNKYFNALLFRILNFENDLIKKNITLPMGLTIYGIAKK